MKKIKVLVPLIATTLASSAVITSCSNNSHFIDVPEQKKQAEAMKGTQMAFYEIQLSNKFDSTHFITAEPTTTSTSTEGLSISIPFVSVAGINHNKIWFMAQMDGVNETEQVWATFDMVFSCKDYEGNVVWTETVKDFKLTIEREKKPEIETHAVTVNNSINNIAISPTSGTISETESLTLTFTNTRGHDLTDSILTFKIGTKVFKLDNSIPTTGSTLEISIEWVNEKLAEKGLEPLAVGEEIEIYSTRKDSYRISSDKRLEASDEYGTWSYVTDLSTVKNKFLVYDSGNNDYTLHSEGITTYLNTLSAEATAELYLLNGEYPLTAPNNAVTLKLNGTYKYNTKTGKLEKTSSFIGYVMHDWFLDISNINLTLNDLHIQCTDENQSHVSDGIHNGFTPKTLSAKNCDFYGPLTVLIPNVSFDNCTFDTTDIEYLDGGALKNQYAIWFYAQGCGNFKDCTFHSGGKAVKYYQDGSPGMNLTSTFTNCTFILDQSHWDNPKPGVKFPFEIDGYGLWSDSEKTNWYFNNIKITGCSYTNYPSSITGLTYVERNIDSDGVNRVIITN